jgi:hypothetical protein
LYPSTPSRSCCRKQVTSEDPRLCFVLLIPLLVATIHEATDDTAGELRLKPSSKSASLSISADTPVHIEGRRVSLLVQARALVFGATGMDATEMMLDSDYLTETPKPAVRTHQFVSSEFVSRSACTSHSAPPPQAYPSPPASIALEEELQKCLA